MLISIVTPTTGRPELLQAAQSVQDQDYKDIEYLIVIDGEERRKDTELVLENLTFTKTTHVLSLPYITGHSRYRGHRIYGGSSFFIQGDFLIYLDEDNWLDPNHVSSLVELVQKHSLDWAYALRKIVDQDGQLITFDNSESLGKYPIWGTADKHHIDTNCFFLKKEISVQLSSIWYRRGRSGLMSPDQALCYKLLEAYPNSLGTKLYTVNYRTQICPQSLHPHPGFFLNGNAWMKSRYPLGYPWRENMNSLPQVFESTQVKFSDLTLGQSLDLQNPTLDQSENSRNKIDLKRVSLSPNFIVLGFHSFSLSWLLEILNQQTQTRCFGEIFNTDQNDFDVIEAKRLLQSESLNLGVVPGFFERVMNELGTERVGLCIALASPTTLRPEEISVLIESGYRLILIRYRQPLKAFCWWKLSQLSLHSQEKRPLSSDVTSQAETRLSATEGSEWIRNYQKLEAWIEEQLKNRLWPMHVIDLEDCIDEHIESISNKLCQYLDLKTENVNLNEAKTMTNFNLHQVLNLQELETSTGHSIR